jgi:hypothetical protein
MDHPIVWSHVAAAAVDAPKPFDRRLDRHAGFAVVGSVTVAVV